MALRAVLFDLGDTLWRYPGEPPEHLARHYEGARPILGEVSALPPAEAIVKAVAERLAEMRHVFLHGPDRGSQPATVQLFAEAMARLGLRPDPQRLSLFVEQVSEIEVEMASAQPPEPDMVEVLESLRSRGLRFACVSNTFMPAKTLARVLDARGLLHFMAEVVSSAEVGFRKPHPDCFRPALESLQVRPEEALFVGDRLNTDVEGSLALGMAAVLTHQYRQEDPSASPFKPHHVIGHLRDLLDLVEAYGVE
jgi:HAD superfamily hydrolase (TIGR01509 family)